MSDDSIFPEIGQHVKCLLVNNTLIEGYVLLWDTNAVKLKSLDGDSIFIIHHSDRDIVMTKVMLALPAAIEPEPKIPVTLEGASNLEERWQETYNEPSDDELRTKKLAELKILMIEQEKKIIKDKMKIHESTSAYSPMPPKYQIPNMAKIKTPRSPYQLGKLPRK